MDRPEDPNLKVGIGWYQPKSIRVDALQHPKGNILPQDVVIPHLSMCGAWLYRLGFRAGRRVLVSGEEGKVTLTLDEGPAELPYRYRRHAPKKKG